MSKKIVSCLLTVVFLLSGSVSAGSSGSSLQWYGDPEYTMAHAYYSEPGHQLFIEVTLLHLENPIDIRYAIDWDYAYAYTPYYRYDHEECDSSYDAVMLQ
jgi:hypothetical protein